MTYAEWLLNSLAIGAVICSPLMFAYWLRKYRGRTR